jgi:cytidine deaminase
VVNAASTHCSPCGACRQVIAEFSSADTDVIYHGANGMVSVKMGDLLPDGFRM